MQNFQFEDAVLACSGKRIYIKLNDKWNPPTIDGCFTK